MLRWLLFILVLLYLHALGYFGPAFKPEEESDRAVILAAMEHLCDWSGSAQLRGSELQSILLARESALARRPVPLMTFPSWPRLFQLNSSMEERNQASTTFAWDGSGRVRLGTVEEIREIRIGRPPSPPYRCTASASRPGYSRDGRFAQLFVSVGPSPHGTAITFILRRDGSSWSVVWREARFYA